MYVIVISLSQEQREPNQIAQNHWKCYQNFAGAQNTMPGPENLAAASKDLSRKQEPNRKI